MNTICKQKWVRVCACVYARLINNTNINAQRHCLGRISRIQFYLLFDSFDVQLLLAIVQNQ